MARDLYHRLKRLKNTHAQHPDGRSSDAPPVQGPRVNTKPTDTGQSVDPALGLAGWSQFADLVYVRETTIPLKRLEHQKSTDGKVHSLLLRREITLGDLCFMDTETTGLSGGAGTTVFLVGAGRVSKNSITVTQAFLADFPGEPLFLDLVHELLWAAPVWVSYNGRAFDSRLLQTRFLMNGRSVEPPEQLDLLYWARRLWRSRIGACSLDDIEREILHHTRDLDVAGIEIPDRYFDFLKSGDPAHLYPVIAHHLQDIVSLAEIFFTMESILSACQDGPVVGARFDRLALGRYLADRDDPACENLIGHNTDPVTDESLPERERAAFALARYKRRTGRDLDLDGLWDSLWGEGSIVAGIELAKSAEHKRRDPEAALALVESMLDMELESRTRYLLEHRKARLMVKLRQ